MKKKLAQLILIFALTGIGTPAFAILPMPDKTGFSGFINVGGGAMAVESNMIAGNGMGDTASERIDSISQGPDSKTNGIPLINFELNYTFAESRTQLIAGNRLEDLLRFDTSSVLGIRQGFSDASSISLYYAFSSFPTSVWEDPYAEGVDREETDRSGEGLRIGYDRILGTPLETEFTWRKLSVDTEKSGETHALTSLQQDLLDRNGRMFSGKFNYPIVIQPKRHMIIPTLEYQRYDLDGDAMAYNHYSILVSYVLNGTLFNVITNLTYAVADFDEENPLFNEKREDEMVGGSLSVFYKNFFGVPTMNLVGTIASYDSASNIDFYDGRVTMGTLSVLYRF